MQNLTFLIWIISAPLLARIESVAPILGLELSFDHLKIEKEWDSFGNLIVETRIGDLTGEGNEERYTIKREFAPDPSTEGFLLCKEKREEIDIEYSYVEGTSLLSFTTIRGKDGLIVSEKREYDEVGELSSITVEEGGQKYRTIDLPEVFFPACEEGAIEHSYTAYGKPSEIIYSDGSKERMRYYRSGLLKEYQDREGVITFFTYNSLGFVVSWAKSDGQRPAGASLIDVEKPSPLKPPSWVYVVGDKPLSTDKMVVFINGINNSFPHAEGHALFLSSCIEKGEVIGIYNTTRGVRHDFLEYLSRARALVSSSDAVEKFFAIAAAFHEKNKENSDAKILFITHSAGSVEGRDALRYLPKELQSRILVLNICPITIIPKELCHNRWHYASNRDFVPLYAMLGRDYKHPDDLVWLDPVSDAPFWDHPFRSPTFREVLRQHLEAYMAG